ncbi:hypothetical protein WAI453_004815 [Rhynchosporium graminicola]
MWNAFITHINEATLYNFEHYYTELRVPATSSPQSQALLCSDRKLDRAYFYPEVMGEWRDNNYLQDLSTLF